MPLPFHALSTHMDVDTTTRERNSCLGVTSNGLKQENQTYMLEKSIAAAVRQHASGFSTLNKASPEGNNSNTFYC